LLIDAIKETIALRTSSFDVTPAVAIFTEPVVADWPDELDNAIENE
jgi:hypothetical protein